MVSCDDQNQDPDRTHLQIRQESKFFTRANSICRDRVLLYYGAAAGSIPFLWETRPGTPKHALSSTDSLFPPLTPPPTYQSAPTQFAKSPPKPTLLVRFRAMLYPTRNSSKNKAQVTSSPSSSSSSSFSFCSKGPIRYEDDYGSSFKSMSVRRQRSGSKRFRGCFPVAGVMKGSLMSLVGRRSSGQGVRG